jgi:hypothetical protein
LFTLARTSGATLSFFFFLLTTKWTKKIVPLELRSSPLGIHTLCRFEEKRGKKGTKNKTTPIVHPFSLGGVHTQKEEEEEEEEKE